MTMTDRKAATLAVLIATGSFPALGQAIDLEYSHTERYAGFGAIDHLALDVGLPLTDKFRSNLRLEQRRQHAVGGNAGASGSFVEGLFNYDLGTSVYGLTRIGFTNENTLFVDNSLYQEFGFKTGQWGPAFIDLNAGIGTRQFVTGRETFISAGPTFSWATGALWLRREQSASAGGHRNLVTLRQQIVPRWHVELFALDEKRRKFTLPIGPGVTGTDFKGYRYSVALGHELTPAVSLHARVERISLERVGTAGKYYAPNAYSLGFTFRF
jgi:hypothetical protein